MIHSFFGSVLGVTQRELPRLVGTATVDAICAPQVTGHGS